MSEQNLPQYINKTKMGFIVRFQKINFKFSKTVKTLKEAEQILKEKLKEYKDLPKQIKINESILVSEEDKYLLTKFKWYIDKKSGYVRANIENKLWLMHRYIMIKILKNDLTPRDLVDHINGIKFDNRRENLRITDFNGNAKNKSKKKDSASKYFGVFINKGRFVTQIRHTGLKLWASYENEEHAAWHYNLWIDEYKIAHLNKNNIQKPIDFVKYIKQEKVDNLPVGILKSGNNFKLQFKSKYIGSYKTLKEAEEKLNNLKENFEKERIENIKNTPIKRNDKNQAIIIVYEKNIKKEIIVDDDMYYKLLLVGSIGFSKNYAYITINNEQYRLHRYIINCYDSKYVVDHIDGNTLNNLVSNLRIVTQRENSQNKSKSKNSSSKYYGVYWIKTSKLWRANININGKNIYLGEFKNENKAAYVRDLKAIESGGNFKLNFPIILERKNKINEVFHIKDFII